VSVDDVHDMINVGSAEVPGVKVLKMINRAEVTLELETIREIDYSNCVDAEEEFTTVLAVIYAICYLMGGSAAFICRQQTFQLLVAEKRGSCGRHLH
jgi:hypothetical protein